MQIIHFLKFIQDQSENSPKKSWCGYIFNPTTNETITPNIKKVTCNECQKLLKHHKHEKTSKNPIQGYCYIELANYWKLEIANMDEPEIIKVMTTYLDNLTNSEKPRISANITKFCMLANSKEKLNDDRRKRNGIGELAKSIARLNNDDNKIEVFTRLIDFFDV